MSFCLSLAYIVSLFMSVFCTFNLFLFDKIICNFPCHDVDHLVVDLVLFFFPCNRATFQGKHVDDPVLAEELLVVEGVVALLVEVVLVRVVELDADLAVSVLLTKEGASMREQLSVLSPGARDNYLTELVGRDNIFSDELLQRFINFVAFILDLSHNREYFAVLDEEVSKSCI